MASSKAKNKEYGLFIKDKKLLNHLLIKVGLQHSEKKLEESKKALQQQFEALDKNKAASEKKISPIYSGSGC